jgi:hypothetical protein
MEMTVRSNNDFEMPLAMAPGVVSHEIPFSSLPLGREMVISSRGLAAKHARNQQTGQKTDGDGSGGGVQDEPATSASRLALILSKMARRCWTKSGRAGSCKETHVSALIVFKIEKKEKKKKKKRDMFKAIPQVKPWRRQPSSPWAVLQVVKAGSGPEHPPPPLGRRRSRKTLW